MLKIGICDDDPTFVDDIEKNIEQTIKKHHWNGKIVKFTDGRKWYEHIENVRVANPEASLPRAIIGDPNDNDRLG